MRTDLTLRQHPVGLSGGVGNSLLGKVLELSPLWNLCCLPEQLPFPPSAFFHLFEHPCFLWATFKGPKDQALCYTQTWRPCRRYQTSWRVENGGCHHCLITGWRLIERTMHLGALGSDIKSNSVRDQMVLAWFCFLISLSTLCFFLIQTALSPLCL